MLLEIIFQQSSSGDEPRSEKQIYACGFYRESERSKIPKSQF